MAASRRGQNDRQGLPGDFLTRQERTVNQTGMIHRTHLTIAVSSLLIAVATGCAPPGRFIDALPPDQVAVQTGIPYSKSGGETLNLDLARPNTGEGPWPAVVCIYGGGWISGSRVFMRPWIECIAAHGYVAVAPTYRLAPKHRFPAPVADVRNCVRWLRRHAREYDIDPNHIGTMGLSAGGHLALMVGVTSDDDRFGPDDVAQGGESARVQAVVNYYGPCDLIAKDWSSPVVGRYLVPFLGDEKTQRTTTGRQASPLSYISKDDPPILTFQGNADPTVPPSQAYELHSRLSQAGLGNELQVLHGLGHGWIDPYLTITRQNMIRFFDCYLKGIISRPPTSTAAE